MSVVTLFLLRHGAHDAVNDALCGRAEGVGLGAAGVAQAHALARRLAREPLAAVYSSAIERTRRTAEAVALPHGLDVKVDPALIEIDFGDWTGARYVELDDRPEWRRWNGDRGRSRPPGGESMLEAQARMAAFLEALRARHPGERIVAASHGDVIKAAVAYALGLPLQFHDRFEIAPGSMTTLALHDAGMTIHGLNAVPDPEAAP